MNIDKFTSRVSGKLVETIYDDKSCLAFVPHLLPPLLSMDDRELSLTLSNADRALGELAGLGHNIPNPQLLIRSFVRREAVLSSKIEGTQTGIVDLYAYEAGQLPLPGINPSPPEADRLEVLNYVRALEYGFQQLETTGVDLDLIMNIHKVLMKGSAGAYKRPGEFRATQNWIGSTNIRSAIFVPPLPAEMKEALTDLDRYLKAPHDYPPLLRLAFIHYQFESIHPFIDGNGRTGRLLIVILLVHWGLLPLPLLYLSAFFERRRDDYFNHLLAVTENGMWLDWVLFFLRGVEEQAKDAIQRAKRLQGLQIEWHRRLVDIKVSTAVLDLADKLFEMPFVSISDAKKLLGISSYNTARRAVAKLVGARILQPFGDEGYGRLFAATEILDLLKE